MGPFLFTLLTGCRDNDLGLIYEIGGEELDAGTPDEIQDCVGGGHIPLPFEYNQNDELIFEIDALTAVLTGRDEITRRLNDTNYVERGTTIFALADVPDSNVSDQPRDFTELDNSQLTLFFHPGDHKAPIQNWIESGDDFGAYPFADESYLDCTFHLRQEDEGTKVVVKTEFIEDATFDFDNGAQNEAIVFGDSVDDYTLTIRRGWNDPSDEEYLQPYHSDDYIIQTLDESMNAVHLYLIDSVFQAEGGAYDLFENDNLRSAVTYIPPVGTN